MYFVSQQTVELSSNDANKVHHLSILTFMMTSLNGNIYRVTGHLCGNSPASGDFPAQRSVTRSFDVFFDLCLNTLLRKQSWGWWFETLSRPLWRHCNEYGKWVHAQLSLRFIHSQICTTVSPMMFMNGINFTHTLWCMPYFFHAEIKINSY